MSYQPGELDKRIRIYRRVKTADGGGGFDISWQSLTNDIWAKVRPLSGKEVEQYSKLNATALYMFVIRFREGVEEDYKIVWNSKDYNIRFIKDRGPRALYLEIFAERGVTV